MVLRCPVGLVLGERLVVLALLSEVAVWQSRGLLLVSGHLLQVLFLEFVDFGHPAHLLVLLGERRRGPKRRKLLVEGDWHLQGRQAIISVLVGVRRLLVDGNVRPVHRLNRLLIVFLLFLTVFLVVVHHLLGLLIVVIDLLVLVR